MTDTIKIIFEDKDVLVIDKPAGLLVHPDGRDEKRHTVCDWVNEKYPEMHDVGESLTLQNNVTITRPGIVHRLDAETSGVMILAKTQDVFIHLKAQFCDRKAEKEYRAYVYGVPKVLEGTIDRPIARNRQKPWLWSAQRGMRGTPRDAVTQYQVLAQGKEASLLALFPKTGRTHQIRVHLKAINHPIVGDSLYAPNHEKILGFSRLALHAYTLGMTMPHGERGQFSAPLPPDFLHAETLLRAE